MSVPFTCESRCNSSTRCLPRLGKKPAKVKDFVSKPDAISAVNAAFAPGNGTTVMPSSIALVTRSAPGSEMAGIPASLTQAIDCPFNKSSIIYAPFSSLLCS